MQITDSFLDVGSRHTCAIAGSGTLYCWGGNEQGQNGHNTIQTCPVPGNLQNPVVFSPCTRAPLPVEDGPDEFVLVTAGGMNTCGLTADGGAFCWGTNYAGQIGNGTNEASGVPVRVTGDYRFRDLDTSGESTCGVATEGGTYCWGRELAPRTSSVGNRLLVPTPVPGAPPFTSVSVSVDHACGLTAAGDAYCWGNNTNGKLGGGTGAAGYDPGTATPVAVAGGHRFKTISAARTHTCAITQSGAAFCWGAGTQGQLGYGGSLSAASPVRVADP